MPESQKEIIKEVGRRSFEQIKNAGYFLGGLAVFECGITVIQSTHAAGDYALGGPTVAVGAYMAMKGGSKMVDAGLRSDFNKKISDRNT